MAMSVSDKTNYKNNFNKENYERIVLYLRHDDKERWKKAAQESEMTISAFVKSCVEKEIGRD